VIEVHVLPARLNDADQAKKCNPNARKPGRFFTHCLKPNTPAKIQKRNAAVTRSKVNSKILRFV
jgi:hypothetical protein